MGLHWTVWNRVLIPSRAAVRADCQPGVTAATAHWQVNGAVRADFNVSVNTAAWRADISVVGDRRSEVVVVTVKVTALAGGRTNRICLGAIINGVTMVQGGGECRQSSRIRAGSDGFVIAACIRRRSVSRQITVTIVVRHRVGFVRTRGRIRNEGTRAAGWLIRQRVRVGPVIGKENWIQPHGKAAAQSGRLLCPTFETAFGRACGSNLGRCYPVDISLQSVVGHDPFGRAIVANVEFALAVILTGVGGSVTENLISRNARDCWISSPEAGESTSYTGNEFNAHV